MLSIRVIVLVLIAGFAGSYARPAKACSLLRGTASSLPDVSAALMDCIAKTAAGGRLELPPGTYRLRRAIVITKPISISTAGLAANSPGCAKLPAGRCATFSIDPQGATEPNILPVRIAANGVSLSHLIVQGVGASSRRRDDCGRPDRRPLSGGIRVSGSRFAVRKSILRDFACYSALEITAGAISPTVEDNVIGPNGDHRPGELWTDGVTIHDSEAAVVRRNVFVDNTDVQLILGGCRSCRIENNQFRHSGPFSKASFAELMLHSWPNTSGNYAGTVVRGNRIDCGPERRCGYGIMVGAAPWYEGRMSGGKITGNEVRNAMIAINIDALSGPVEIHDNQVRSSGGRYQSDCGVRDWPAVNIAPRSVARVRGDPSDQPEKSLSTSGCLLNRQPR